MPKDQIEQQIGELIELQDRYRAAALDMARRYAWALCRAAARRIEELQASIDSWRLLFT